MVHSLCAVCIFWEIVDNSVEWFEAGSVQNPESHPCFWIQTPRTTALTLRFPYINHWDVQPNFSSTMKALAARALSSWTGKGLFQPCYPNTPHRYQMCNYYSWTSFQHLSQIEINSYLMYGIIFIYFLSPPWCRIEAVTFELKQEAHCLLHVCVGFQRSRFVKSGWLHTYI